MLLLWLLLTVAALPRSAAPSVGPADRAAAPPGQPPVVQDHSPVTGLVRKSARAGRDAGAKPALAQRGPGGGHVASRRLAAGRRALPAATADVAGGRSRSPPGLLISPRESPPWTTCGTPSAA